MCFKSCFSKERLLKEILTKEVLRSFAIMFGGLLALAIPSYILAHCGKPLWSLTLLSSASMWAMWYLLSEIVVYAIYELRQRPVNYMVQITIAIAFGLVGAIMPLLAMHSDHNSEILARQYILVSGTVPLLLAVPLVAVVGLLGRVVWLRVRKSKEPS